ncbi:MAG: RHS repeat-associated core domain-containing protein [Flavobacteriales bacterium]|nr:RHS repeat-associated core domain-containing protein [Flavobacteriales bacterium]MBK7103618.1 RHS repeat-associated core domain-containing protein [Flavobacteriales bacterium]MBK7111723.1 RHS repeat-associated core domain-containing protein [Flavobacteriales bacterium]HQW07394.1 RHS repeat-associated core domain-containing protein [Flavobacteriales bacterium]
MKAVHADAARTHTLASFTYDAGGNRLLKVAYATDGTTPTESTWYLRDGSGGVLSYTHVDELLQTTTEELPIAGVGSYLRASLKTRYEVSDHLGNTRVSFTTDGNGDVLVIEAHDYYPHGGLLPGRQLSGTGGSPLAYQGQEYDPEVGLTAFNLRQYDGRIGRWLTTDPFGQHHSPYLAMSNNPVSFVDPDGGYDQRDRLIDEIWDSGLGLSAAFSNWDEYYLYRDEQDQYDQGYMVEDYQAYYSYQYCQWRQVVTIGGRSESVLMQTKRSHERIDVYISRRHMTTGERIYERVSRNLKQRPGYFDGMGKALASGFMETLHTSLDLVGMAPGIGEGADVVNGLIYLAEGDRWNATISFAGAVAVVGGQAITGARLLGKVANAPIPKPRLPGPTIDPLTGQPVGRFIGNQSGPPMIEPVGGSTVSAGRGGVDTHTLYPNGSNYQRLNPVGHPNNPTPHAHGHALGTGPGMNGQGPSLDRSGNVVPWNSTDAHWPFP